MKNSGKIFLICAALVFSVPSVQASNNDDIVVVPSRNKNFFVLKADRKLVGARIEVLYADGDVVTRQMLERRKMIIDFGDVKAGSYIIRVTKGGRVEEFEYNKT